MRRTYIYIRMDERLSGSGSPIVTMMQPAESLMRQDATEGYGPNSPGWRPLPESKMRAVFVVVADVFREQPLQMAFIHRNDVVQQIMSAAFNPTLRRAVLPRAFERGSDWPHLQRSNSYGNLKSVLAVPVKDQKPRSRPEGKRFSQLLDGPQAGRVLGHVEMQDAPTVVADDEETVEHAEGDRWDGEEIHCGDRFPMVTQKCEPTPGWFGTSRRPAHPARDGSFRDIKTQHEKLAMNPRCSPSRILVHDPEDQLANFLRSLSSPNLPPDFRDQPPIHLKTGPVPTDHGFGRDHDERLFPLWPESTDGNPEELVEDAEARPRATPLQHSELLPEHEVLEEEIPAVAEEAEEPSEPEQNQVDMAGVITERWRQGGRYVIDFIVGQSLGEAQARRGLKSGFGQSA
jgi:hypothetical protein